MRLLLDESAPRRFRSCLSGHQVQTVVEMGWAGVKNGQLLRPAAASFDVLITVDQNLPHQQNQDQLPIAVLILIAESNAIGSLMPLVQSVLTVLDQIEPRTIAWVRAEG